MFSKFFIERPIFATVISLIIVIAGLVAMKSLPASQYPTITPVQVQVTATYPGADSKTVGDSVASPIEAQINGVDNMLYMTSTSSSTGQMTLTVFFTLNTDPDIAQVQVQNRVNLAVPQLPSAVVQGLSVMDATIQAGEERLRPIIMTSLAFIFGVLPLAIATGAGANARHSIGTGIMGGMIGEATLAMLYVPLFFYIFDKLSERSGAKKELPRPSESPPEIEPHENLEEI